MSTIVGSAIPFTGLQRQYNLLREEVLDATDTVLRSGQLMNGVNTDLFELWLANRNQVAHAVTCHSGTHALEIIAEYWAREFARPCKVLIPSITYVATANAFIRAGWDVEFIDVDAYGLMDFNKIPEDCSYEAVVLVGLYGHPITHHAGVKEWTTWLRNQTAVFEDAAQHWLSADSRRIGQAAAISFDPMKNLANYGNGGAVVTQNSDLAEFARSWRDAGKPNYEYAGTNSRMSEIDCATMMVKTKYIDQWQHRRAVISDYWRERFANSPVRCLINELHAHNHAHHKFVIDVDRRDQLRQHLTNRGIETRIHYEKPLHELDEFQRWAGPNMLATASSFSRRVLSLPLHPELTDAEVEFIADQVLNCAA